MIYSGKAGAFYSDGQQIGGLFLWSLRFSENPKVTAKYWWLSMPIEEINDVQIKLYGGESVDIIDAVEADVPDLRSILRLVEINHLQRQALTFEIANHRFIKGAVDTININVRAIQPYAGE